MAERRFSYSDYVPNPNVAFLWLWIDGELITIENNRPKYFVSFSHERTQDAAFNQATITLFDPEWYTVEEKLINSQSIDYQYGYTTGLKSPIFHGYVLYYTPMFTIDGVKLTIVVNSLSAKLDKVEISKAWIDPETGEGYKPERIVELIAESLGYTADVEETNPILDNESLVLARPIQKIFKQDNMKNMTFIHDVLLREVNSKLDKEDRYYSWTDDSAKVIYFKRPKKKGEPKYIYRYMRDKDSAVISFSPDIPGGLMLRRGAGSVGAGYIDVQTGDYDFLYTNNRTTPNKSLLGGEITIDGIVEDERTNVALVCRPRDKVQADSFTRAGYYDVHNRAYGAGLQVFGDPTLYVNDLIEMVVLQPDGKKHYTSGPYRVLGVTDAITTGVFTTSIKLMRNATTKGDDEFGDGEGQPIPEKP